ncbi:hypothetical protein ACKWTF_001918 [Chironomus riparius]
MDIKNRKEGSSHQQIWNSRINNLSLTSFDSIQNQLSVDNEELTKQSMSNKTNTQRAMLRKSWTNAQSQSLALNPTTTLYNNTKIDVKFRCYVTPSSEQRVCLWSVLSWTELSLYNFMVRKDEKALLRRKENMLESHQKLSLWIKANE